MSASSIVYINHTSVTQFASWCAKVVLWKYPLIAFSAVGVSKRYCYKSDFIDVVLINFSSSKDENCYLRVLRHYFACILKE